MKIFAITYLLVLTSCANAYELSRSALDNRNENFIPHTTPAPFQRYVSYEISYGPVKSLLEELEKNTGKLKNRGEAHITVITPPEFDQVLGKKITIEEINAIALQEKIQHASYEPVCVGMGTLGELRTYYIVVNSPELLSIRHKVKDLYVARGGAEKSFDPERFYPHITLGFTERDLHESDGIIKDELSCLPEGEISLN